MTLHATIYDFSFQRLLNSFYTRLEYYVRLDNGQIIVLGEVGTVHHLRRKFQLEENKDVKSDAISFKDRSCELIQDAQGDIRFR
ncbi:MAG: hypothetical protein WKF88_08725, partial [Ferruginibacter sp.]